MVSNAEFTGHTDPRLQALPTVKIVGRQDYTEDLFKLWLEPSVPFTFKPGQYITIGSKDIERPYSIASSPHEEYIELFIEYVHPEHGGKLTPLLYAQNVGDILSMRPRAKGIFLLDENYSDHVLVGTVTGIVPYVSYIRQFLNDKRTGHRFFVMEGASHFDEFVYDQEFEELQSNHDFIEFVSTVSRPNDPRNKNWHGSVGRVNNLVPDNVDRWGLSKQNTMIYLCGNPGMIEDVKDKMGSAGWNYCEERFWKEEDD
ncbi:MAG: hypothetical protein CL889_03880 [Dehalococcoidia bacterium]|nr:hypothetical protein [Dehalococcoidia bacterium]